MSRTILVTGGAGFIGSNFVLQRIAADDRVITLDKLTCAGNLSNLSSLDSHPSHMFVQGGIEDEALLRMLLVAHQPEAVVNIADERYPVSSSADPGQFVLSYVMGTFRLLQASLAYYRSLTGERQSRFRFLHVSSDEAYGVPDPPVPAVDESGADPQSSRYSASKSGSDHLVRTYQQTYRLPTLTINCSSNYGPYQYPEKLVPLMILNALHGRPLPIYGDGLETHDWLYVRDVCDAIALVLERGAVGETYNIGGGSEKTNLEVVAAICSFMDELHPAGAPHNRLITLEKYRPGHDRHAIDASKLHNELGWRPHESFESGLRRTIEWYLSNSAWIEQVTSGGYRECITANYESRSDGSLTPKTQASKSPASVTPSSLPHSAVKEGQ